jgi:hypothetical protein
MRGRQTLRAGVVLAAVAVGLFSAGCFPGGPPGPANLSANPSQLTFTAVHSSFMPTLRVTVTNTGGRSVQGLSALPAGVYSLPSTGAPNPCQGSGALPVLAPGQSCVVDVQFCPTTIGPDSKTLVVSGQDATSGSPVQVTVALNGTAT